MPLVNSDYSDPNYGRQPGLQAGSVPAAFREQWAKHKGKGAKDSKDGDDASLPPWKMPSKKKGK